MDLGNKFNVLLYLAEKTNQLKGKLILTTGEIAQEVKVSQQTVSRILREFEMKGLMERKVTGHGIVLSFTEKGKSYLKNKYYSLERIFSAEKTSLVTGKVQSGLGEGRYYMSLPGYQQRIISQLGFNPYLGTLNLKVNGEDLDRLLFDRKEIKIESFVTEERTFGGLRCYPLRLKKGNLKVSGALIFPERSHHDKNVVEFITDVNLRKKLKLEDGEEVVLIL